jgi:hypothetical protein
VRPDSTRVTSEKPAWRLGASVIAIDEEARDDLVRYCYVVHPWERLRTARLEAFTASPAPARAGGTGGGDAPVVEHEAAV